MQINKTENREDIRIQQFVRGDKSMTLNELTIQVLFNTSTFAIAAMLKGLEEYYFKPAELKADEEIMKSTEHNLKVWNEINEKKNSRIITP